MKPVDHRSVVASLTAKERNRLTARSDIPGVIHLGAHWGAIVTVGSLIAAKVPGWPFLMLPQGILIVFLFALLHETIHQTAFRTQWLNEIIARVCSLAIALPADWFRYFHFAHHRYTQDPENDPELAKPKPETLAQYLIHVSGLPMWRSHLSTLCVNAAGRCRDKHVPPKGHGKVRIEAQAMIAFYVVVFLLAVY